MADLWYADCGSYLRVPVDLQQVVADCATVEFEIGTAMRCAAVGGREAGGCLRLAPP